MSNDNNFIPPQKPYVPLRPFQIFCKNNFPFIENTFESLDIYGLLCNVVKYLNDVIANENIVTENAQALYNAFVQLNNYVENYFDNLDVQEEINNKLDEMAESGELQEIIAQFLESTALWTFDTVESMQEATNLVSGSYAKTLGYYEKNDKGAMTYYITNNVTGIDYYITLDSGLYAIPVVSDTVNIKQYGAKGDGETDDTTAIQNAINSTAKIIEIPETENYYKVIDDITLKSNKTIKGFGQKSKILMPNNLVKTIFILDNTENVTIDNIKLCNESCQTGSSPDLSKNKIIWGEICENITIKNCYFENVYSRGILFRKAKNIYYIENEFKNTTYEMLTLLQEVENVFVDRCVFDTVISTYQNSYLFCTGRIDTETYEFSCRNIHVTNSKFLNNPNWEGIDTHGCVGFYAENNYIENVKCGIMASLGTTAPITSSSEKHKDIYILNNVIKGHMPQDNNSFGIVVGAGNTETESMYIAENIVVKGNHIENFGNTISTGGIAIRFTKNFILSDNVIKYSLTQGLLISGAYNGEISNNKILESETNGVNMQANCWNVTIKDNIIQNLEKTKLTSGIRSSANLQNYVKIHNNSIYATNPVTNLHVNQNIYNDNAIIVGKVGDIMTNQYGLPTRYCTDTILRLHKAPTVTVSGLEGTNIIYGTNLSYFVGEGLEIILPIGENGADITTILTKIIDKNTFEIKDTILTTISGVTPTFTAGTWTEIS